MNNIKNRKAFTIVELVIVIAVIAVLATVLVPTFGNVIQNAKDTAAKQEAMNLYKEYLTEAAASGDVAETLAIDTGNDRYFVFTNGRLQEAFYSSIRDIRADYANAKLLQKTNDGFDVSSLAYSNVVVVGNSWTNHNPNTNIGWYAKRGMAASVQENDFVSLLEIGLKSYDPNVSVQRVNVAKWERDEANSIKLADDYLSADTDLIVIRLGENVNNTVGYSDRLYAFIDHMKSLAPNAEFLVCTTGLTKLVDDTKKAANQAGAILAEGKFDSVDRLAQVGQYIYSDSESKQITHSGVANHPSDVGMALVANSVLSSIGYDQINVIYEIKYVEITSSNSYRNPIQWVRNGLVTVYSNSPIAVQTDSGKSIDVEDRGDGYYTFYMPEEGVTVSVTD